MTEQERNALEQAMKPQKWGATERVALVAEVLRQRRMVDWLVRDIVENFGECPPDKKRGDVCKEGAGCFACWRCSAEQAVANEISPKA